MQIRKECVCFLRSKIQLTVRDSGFKSWRGLTSALSSYASDSNLDWVSSYNE